MDDYFPYAAGPGDLGGGIGLRGVTAPAVVRNYLAVDDVDATLAAVSANGGAVVTPRTDISFGWYAAVADTEGNELGLVQVQARGLIAPARSAATMPR